jgi:hypothetical protein
MGRTVARWFAVGPVPGRRFPTAPHFGRPETVLVEQGGRSRPRCLDPASPHHREDDDDGQDDQECSESDVHSWTPSLKGVRFRPRGWTWPRQQLLDGPILLARCVSSLTNPPNEVRRRGSRIPGRRAGTAEREAIIPQRCWAIGNLPGVERIHLMRYQGPEQRSREGASANGRVQHGAGTPSVLKRTVPPFGAAGHGPWILSIGA